MTFEQLMQAGFLFGLIHALRKQWPKLDGRYVWAVAILSGLAVSYLTIEGAIAWRVWVLRGLIAGVGAIAMDGGVTKIGTTVGSAMAPRTGTSLPPPPDPSPGDTPRS